MGMASRAVPHVEDTVDPVRDLEIIANELLQKDIAFVESQRGPLAKEVGRDGKAKEKKDRLEIMEKIYKWVAGEEGELWASLEGGEACFRPSRLAAADCDAPRLFRCRSVSGAWQGRRHVRHGRVVSPRRSTSCLACLCGSRC